jgi:hypothetical protein
VTALKVSVPTTFISDEDRAGQGKFIWQMDEFVQQGDLTRTFE